MNNKILNELKEFNIVIDEKSFFIYEIINVDNSKYYNIIDSRIDGYYGYYKDMIPEVSIDTLPQEYRTVIFNYKFKELI